MTAKRALVLEDDRNMRQLLSALLREQGFIDTAIPTPPDEQDLFSRFKYALGLVDIGLGETSGLDFVRTLRANRYHINRAMPIVVVSGQNNRNAIEQARDCGADAFLVKPVSVQSLSAKIEAVMSSRRHFIEANGYCGPDRRRARSAPYTGPERRGKRNDDFYL